VPDASRTVAEDSPLVAPTSYVNGRTSSDTGQKVRDVEVLILGAGVCGIAAAIGCQRADIDDIVIIERASEVGGTWHHNTYPGCAVDIPSHVYSFSYAPNPDWSRLFAPQAELKQYLVKVTKDFGLESKIALNTEVLDAAWDEEAQRWIVQTSGGVCRARAFVVAAGPLHEPIIPHLPGLSVFKGPMFHSSAWPQEIDLTGKRVVVIGTGASAIQFIPSIQPTVGQITVLQRTPSWVMPKPDWDISNTEKRLLRRFPALARVLRLSMWGPMDVLLLLATHHLRFARATSIVAKLHMRRSVKDPELRRALTPTYAPTCKRLGLSNDYYAAMAQPNVQLVTSPAAEFREHSVVTTDGREFGADVVILGTGFQTIQHHPVNKRVRGRDGRTLEDVWQGSPKAYMGTTVSGFPNSFIMFGPNAGTLSGFVMAEAQTDYLVGALKAMRANGLSSIDVRPEEQATFVAECDKVLKNSTFAVGGCASYYLDDTHGRVTLAWPWSMTQLRRRLAKFDLAPYRLEAKLVSADMEQAATAIK
jgi:cation diffusion facilitator CzcD-associated flavoprotein CzcO